MAAYTFSSFKEFMDSLSSSSRTRIESQEPNEHPYVTEMFGELYFRESPVSSVFPPLSSSSSTSLTDLTQENKTKKLNDDNAKELRRCCGKNNREKEKKSTVKHSEAKQRHVDSIRLFPPPITCLRSVKNGKPFVYYKFDADVGRIVPEEVRIPARSFLRTHREDGRLKMYFVHPDEEIEEEEEEEEKKDEEEEEEVSHDEIEGKL